MPPAEAHKTFYNFHKENYGAIEKKTTKNTENIDETKTEDQNSQADNTLSQKISNSTTNPSDTETAILSKFFTSIPKDSKNKEGERILRPLPPGWEVAIDADNQEYYIK